VRERGNMQKELPVYRIRYWDKHFENHESRKVKSLAWVPVKNKHDGAGYRRVAALPNSVQVFCGWSLIIQVASRMPTRGVLRDDDGALDPADLASKTGFPETVFKAAFDALIHPKIRWLELIEPGESPGNGADSGRFRDAPGDSGVEQKGTEGNRTEQKGMEDTEGAAVAASPDVKGSRKAEPITDEWLKEIATDYTHLSVPLQFTKASNWIRTNPGRTLSRKFFINWLNRIDPPPQVGGSKESRSF
jgi:hypothetical protein